MAAPLRVLLVDDDDARAESVLVELRRGNSSLTAERVATEESFKSALQRGGWAVIICRAELSALNFMAVLAHCRQTGGNTPVIFVSDQSDEATAAAARRAGAADYLGGTSLHRLCTSIDRVVRETEEKLRQEVSAMARHQEDLAKFGQWVLVGRELEELLAGAAERVARALGADFCEVLELTPKEDAFLLSAGYGWQPGCVGGVRLAATEESQAGATWRGGVAVLVDDWAVETRLQASALLRQHNVGSSLTVPLNLHGRRFGVLGVHARRAGAFSAGALQYLEALASTLATAIERKLTEEALRESDERFRLLVEEVRGYAIITLDTNACVTTWNSGAQNLFGYVAAEMTGQHVSRLYPLSDVELGKPELDLRLAEEMGQFEDEDWRLQKGGTVFWANVVITALRRADGKLRGYGMVTRDMTERRQAVEALRLNEEKFRSLVNHIPDAVWTVNAGGEVLFISGNAERIYGYSAEELRLQGTQLGLGRVHPDDLPRVQEAWRSLFERQQRFEVECRYERKDGRQVWLLLRSSAIYEKDGQLVADGITSDITERKRADVALRDSAKQIQAQARLLDLAGDAIVVRNLDHEVLYWNRGAERIYGWTAEEARGRRVTELLFKNTESFEAAQAELLDKGEWSGELRQWARDGREVTVASRWTLVRDETGRPSSVLVLNTDITEKKRLESQFLRAQRMESIGTLAGGVAHDLNNILSPIMMSAPLLRMSELPADDRERLLDTIETNAQRGSDIVKQLLAFGRGVEGERVVVQVRHIIKEMIKIARETFPKNIALGAEVAEGLWPIMGDPTHVHQILLNLCINARDAMPNGGNLKVVAENIQLDEQYILQDQEAKHGPFVSIRVTDSGTGIPKQILDKIFDPFFTTKEVGKGTGLGLATVMGIVKGYGGLIHVYSEVGKGTSFNILLPAVPNAAAAAAESVREPLPVGRGETILVVDDEAGILAATCKLLERHNYKVIPAADGAEALTLFSKHRSEVRLIMTDVMMPVMDGLALTRVVKRIDPDILMLAASGLEHDAKFDELRAAGVQFFLTKPFTAEKLLHTLREVLAGVTASHN